MAERPVFDTNYFEQAVNDAAEQRRQEEAYRQYLLHRLAKGMLEVATRKAAEESETTKAHTPKSIEEHEERERKATDPIWDMAVGTAQYLSSKGYSHDLVARGEQIREGSRWRKPQYEELDLWILTEQPLEKKPDVLLGVAMDETGQLYQYRSGSTWQEKDEGVINAIPLNDYDLLNGLDGHGHDGRGSRIRSSDDEKFSEIANTSYDLWRKCFTDAVISRAQESELHQE